MQVGTEAELDALRQSIEEQIKQQQSSTQPEEPSNQTQAESGESEKAQDTSDIMEEIDKIYQESEVPKPEVELPPQEILQSPEKLKEWMQDQLNRKVASALTKVRQKEKKKVQEKLESLKAEDVFKEPPQPEKIDAPSIEDVYKKLPKENLDELKPVIETFREVARAEMKPFLEEYAQMKALQRHQLEKQHFEEFLNKYKGFPITQEMVEQAKLVQRNHPDPNVRNSTVAQIMEAMYQPQIMEWKINSLVEQRLKEIMNQKKEHPGGSPGPSQERQPETVNFDLMSDEEKVKWYEENLPKAET